MGLLERHVDFVEALRRAGLPVSLAEDLDAARAVGHLDLLDRESLRAAYAATLVKRPAHRESFDTLFDLWFPARSAGAWRPGEDGGGSDGAAAADDEDRSEGRERRDGEAQDGPRGPGRPDDGAALADLRERLAEELSRGAQADLSALAREAVGRFGAVRSSQPGQQSWSAYAVGQRVRPEELVEQLLEGLARDVEAGTRDGLGEGVAAQALRGAGQRFSRLVDAEVRRLTAQERGAEHVAQHSVRPALEQVDFLRAKRADLEAMRREIHPLARRLAVRLTREHHHARKGQLDVRRTVRASIGTGGVPVVTHHRPKRPHKPELVVLCDVSGSCAPFAQFTLSLVFALREQFTRVRAFTFIDAVTEVTHVFRPGADLGTTLEELAASARYAALWGRTSYGRAFTQFVEKYPDAVTPRTSLLVLGDARSNYGDLGLDALREMVGAAKHAWLLNPEGRAAWGSGDSAVAELDPLLPVVECRNLAQLEAFVHDLA